MSVYKETLPSAPPMSPTGRVGVSKGAELPDLNSPGLEPVQDAVMRDGLLGFYVALNMSDLGSE